MSTQKNLKNYLITKNEVHPFHLVDPSPWPFFVALAIPWFPLQFITYFHNNQPGFFWGDGPISWLDQFASAGYSQFASLFIYLPLKFFQYTGGYILFLYYIWGWLYDVHAEGTYEGHHTRKVRQGLRLGFLLFLVSEGMFFVSFFWAFFHFSLNPSPEIGCVWPPSGMITINPWGLPLLNTALLLSSCVSLLYAQRAMRAGLRRETIIGLVITIAYGLFFMNFQYYEYTHAPFNINDSVYGSIFYMLTGLHGMHVLFGVGFLVVALIRHIRYHLMVENHLNLDFAAWYWHFVDAVWIILFIAIYWWGS